MKLLLSTVLSAALVAIPISAEGKSPRPAKSCSGVELVEHKQGRKVVRYYLACPQKVRAPRFVLTNPWG